MIALANVLGWLLLPMLATTISLPYLLRRSEVVRALAARRWVRGTTLLQRMRPHYWLGYVIAGIVLVHALIAVSVGLAHNTNVGGLYLATGALLLVLGQLALGDALRLPELAQRVGVRKVHFACMLGIAALVVGHVALNSPAIQGWLR